MIYGSNDLWLVIEQHVGRLDLLIDSCQGNPSVPIAAYVWGMKACQIAVEKYSCHMENQRANWFVIV